MNTFVIAEAGLNFTGSYDKACQMVDAAKRAGADAVKFQTFLPDFDSNLARFTLTEDQWLRLAAYCLEQKIIFMSTPFDRWAFKVLAATGMKHWKVPSGEMVNDEYLEMIPEQAQMYYVSTGMATEEEIDHALDILPGPMDKDICLMYCVSGYPTPPNQLALHHILEWQIAKYPQYSIGFSDHTAYSPASMIAVALGAEVIEKHFMLEGDTEVVDHSVSEDENFLKAFIDRIRFTEQMVDSPLQKICQPCEADTLKVRNRFK
jgi:sialic acid synthase SpsE